MEIDKKEFDKLVDQAYQNIPAHFRNEIENVIIVIELNPPEKYSGGGILLGLYEGVPKIAPFSVFRGIQPSKITLFQSTIQSYVKNSDQLGKLIQEVLMHEVAHYFGYNDQQLVYMDAKLRQKLGWKD